MNTNIHWVWTYQWVWRAVMAPLGVPETLWVNLHGQNYFHNDMKSIVFSRSFSPEYKSQGTCTCRVTDARCHKAMQGKKLCTPSTKSNGLSCNKIWTVTVTEFRMPHCSWLVKNDLWLLEFGYSIKEKYPWLLKRSRKFSLSQLHAYVRPGFLDILQPLKPYCNRVDEETHRESSSSYAAGH